VSAEREAIERLTAERNNAMAIADRWRGLCETATSGAKVALTRAEQAEAEVLSLRQRIGEMAGGLLLKGWWCMFCGIFSSSEKEELTECRSCGKPRTVLP
jgi:rubrerythrin